MIYQKTIIMSLITSKSDAGGDREANWRLWRTNIHFKGKQKVVENLCLK